MLGRPKRILWPTDFSELSQRAGRYAHGLAQLFSAEMHILHVVPPPLNPDVAVLLPSDVPIPISEPELRAASFRAIRDLIDKKFSGFTNAIAEVRFGNPWSVVCDYAKEKLVELVVVATHGRTGLGHALIGSTAERIVQHAPCPVLTVKASGQGFLQE